MGRQSCEECKDTYKALSTQRPYDKAPVKQILPPCDSCRVGLHPENFEIINVYYRCSDDWITEGVDGNRTAIASQAIESAMNICGISGQEKRADIFDLVKIIGRKVAMAMSIERAQSQPPESTAK